MQLNVRMIPALTAALLLGLAGAASGQAGEQPGPPARTERSQSRTQSCASLRNRRRRAFSAFRSFRTALDLISGGDALVQIVSSVGALWVDLKDRPERHRHHEGLCVKGRWKVHGSRDRVSQRAESPARLGLLMELACRITITNHPPAAPRSVARERGHGLVTRVHWTGNAPVLQRSSTTTCLLHTA